MLIFASDVDYQHGDLAGFERYPTKIVPSTTRQHRTELQALRRGRWRLGRNKEPMVAL
jgi:hypothetical protein